MDVGEDMEDLFHDFAKMMDPKRPINREAIKLDLKV
jgi:hypothetical protein